MNQKHKIDPEVSALLSQIPGYVSKEGFSEKSPHNNKDLKTTHALLTRVFSNVTCTVELHVFMSWSGRCGRQSNNVEALNPIRLSQEVSDLLDIDLGHGAQQQLNSVNPKDSRKHAKSRV